MNHEQGLYLEDLYVGQRFTSDTYRMDEERIKAFAAEFDPQPFHLDQDPTVMMGTGCEHHGLIASESGS